MRACWVSMRTSVQLSGAHMNARWAWKNTFNSSTQKVNTGSLRQAGLLGQQSQRVLDPAREPVTVNND